MEEKFTLQQSRTFSKGVRSEDIKKDTETNTGPELFVHHLKNSSKWKVMACVRRFKTLKSEGRVRKREDRGELEDQEFWKQTGFHL